MSSALGLILTIILGAILLDLLFLRWMGKQYRVRQAGEQDVYVLGTYSPLLTWIKINFPIWRQNGINLSNLNINWEMIRNSFRSSLKSKKLFTVLEILTIVVWGLIISRPYINLDQSIVPAGREYLSAIQTHHLWNWLKQCGLCAMWNGSVQGGYPAFAEPHGSMLHPLVALMTLFFGVTNGAKFVLVIGFILAGIAQWWLGRVIGVGLVARLWSALMAVAAGNLAAAMETGFFGLVLSLVCSSFVIPILILFTKNPSIRWTILLGIAITSIMLAGQGYIQVGLLAILISALFLVSWLQKDHVKLIARRFILACSITLLLMSPLLIPLLHFLPNFTKPIDPEFLNAQPLEYIPLNLVINDHDFYRVDSLSKLPYPSLYENFIGWVVVFLAVYSIFIRRTEQESKIIKFFFTATLLIFLTASAIPMKWLVGIIPDSNISFLISSIRNPSHIAELAIAPILGLSAIGLDTLIKKNWSKLHFVVSSSQTKPIEIRFDLRLLLIVPLLLSLSDARAFGEQWIYTVEQDSNILKVNQALRTQDLQWVNPPFGAHDYIESAVGMGLKLSYGAKPWTWKDREPPKPVLDASFSGVPEGLSEHKKIDGITIYKAPPGREYARIEYSSEIEPTICTTLGAGGQIDVECQGQSEGTLIVKENSWSGWRAYVDGIRTPLLENQWLSVNLQSGTHSISFRYRPWDVPLGILLSLIGIGWCIYLWLTDKEINAQDANQTELTSY